MLYLFDVDLTLAPSNQMMEKEKAEIFREWAKGRKFFFISGAQLEKMRTQIPDDIMAQATGWFPQLGGEFYFQGQLKYSKTFSWPEGLKEDLERILKDNPYEARNGDHVQERGTMLCLCIPGKNSNLDQRAHYVEWDQKFKDRENIVAELAPKYPMLNFVIGGETSIDISEKGSDKSQALPVLREIYGDEPCMFFGDKMMEGGNDMPLAEALRAEANIPNKPTPVESPDHTMTFLQEMIAESQTEKKAG